MTLGRHPAWCTRRHRTETHASDPVTCWNAAGVRITTGIELKPTEPQAAVAIVVLNGDGVTALRLTFDQAFGLYAGLTSTLSRLENLR